jgi:transposase
MEVFTGAGRRRAWTAEQKARIIAESEEGGETVSAVARRHGLTPQQLFSWRRQGLRRTRAAGDESRLTFAPVIVEAAAACPAAGQPGGALMVEIVLGAVTVRVPLGIDPVSLTAVLRAVRAST